MYSYFIFLTRCGRVFDSEFAPTDNKETSTVRVIGLCLGSPPLTDGLPAQRDSNAENASIRWRHNVLPGLNVLQW